MCTERDIHFDRGGYSPMVFHIRRYPGRNYLLFHIGKHNSTFSLFKSEKFLNFGPFLEILRFDISSIETFRVCN